MRPGPDGGDAARAAQGDAEAFERLYRVHVARVHTLARRMAGDGHADDLTQEVFIRAWMKLGTFRGTSSFGTWLHRLAVNLILSKRATLARQRDRMVAGDGHVEGYSHQEISETMGISVGTSKSQLHRARMLLREHLN